MARVWPHMPPCTCGDTGTTFRSCFSPFTLMWVLGTGLRSTGFEVKAFTTEPLCLLFDVLAKLGGDVTYGFVFWSHCLHSEHTNALLPNYIPSLWNGKYPGPSVAYSTDHTKDYIIQHYKIQRPAVHSFGYIYPNENLYICIETMVSHVYWSTIHKSQKNKISLSSTNSWMNKENGSNT